VPHWVLGETIEPSVSVPNENPTRPAVVAEAEPADEPLYPCSDSTDSWCGLETTDRLERARQSRA
jgi:hypothetical protein